MRKRVVEDWIAVLAMALLCLITMGNVLVRYFSDRSFAWTEEISVFLLVVMTLAGAAAAAARDNHVRIYARWKVQVEPNLIAKSEQVVEGTRKG